MKPKPRKAANKKTSRGRAHGEEGFGVSEQLYRPVKKPVTLRLDADILLWFKSQGRGYQTRINRALRGLMLKERRSGK